MSVAHIVLGRIKRDGEDRLWTYKDFADLPTLAVSGSTKSPDQKASHSACPKGCLLRPARYAIRNNQPGPSSVAAAVLTRRGIAWSPSGLAAYNRLGLTTQVSPTTTFAVSRKVRLTSADGSHIKLSLRPAAVVRGASADERAVLDALRELRWIPDTTPEHVIERIADLFRSNRVSFERVARFARREPPRVRAALGAIGNSIGADANILEALKRSLNPTTHFSLRLSDKLAPAREWNIR
ncbi:MAG: hypothetical protein L0387_28785 [Acidobacteria bacterium]|nr:hypothetical protein [Acidobacteriota bacterium]